MIRSAIASGEAFYLRDEESGNFWSPTPLPSRGAMPYVSRHGFGYSVFEHTEGGIRSELWVYVALDGAGEVCGAQGAKPVGAVAHVYRRRAMSNGCWAICGRNRQCTSITDIDPASGALFARNPYSAEFARARGFLRCG